MKQEEIVNEIRRMCGQTKRENNLQKIGYFVSILFINGKNKLEVVPDTDKGVNKTRTIIYWLL